MSASTREHFDVAVVGLGAFGSAATCYLARRGLAVCGVDRYEPPHDRGSSHGASRIFREAYAEDPLYVPWLQRSYELWDRLEQQSGRSLLTRCGGLMLGARDTELIMGARTSARLHGLDSEILDPEDLERQWPGTFKAPAGTVATFDSRAGVLKPEVCIDSFLTVAREAGADLRFGSEARSWESDAGGLRLELDHGATITADRLVIAAGPWISELAPVVAPHLEISRQVMHWFEAAAGSPAGPDRLPIFMWEHDSPRLFYGFPDEGEGVKIAIHHEGELTSVAGINRDVAPSEVDAIRALLDRYMPNLCGEWQRSAVCMYTNTPDGHFLLDRHPEDARVILASPCSGHGFKFATALGEAIADLAQDLEPRTTLAAFSLERFTAPRESLTRVRTGAARFAGQLRQERASE